ncbi:MAG: TSUP family transporter [Clostridia bacterium]|nr:TSUP family transporter [Clostridia bacterium]
MNISALLAGLFSGILGSMGLGGGGILIIYLALFTDTKQLTAQGINLLFFIPIGILSIIIYSIKKQIKWKPTLKIAVFGIIGAIIGILLADVLGGDITRKIFGGLLILMGISELFKKTNRIANKK